MKGMMRRRLLALLSAAGLAGTATSVSGQVLKGDQADKTKSESTVKANKAKREHAAVQSKDVDKSSKAVAEQKAAQGVVNEKVGPDHIVHKHIAGVKYEDAASKDAAKMTKVTNGRKAGGVQVEDKRKTAKLEQENAAAAAQNQGQKSTAEKNALQKATWVKGGKTQGETNKKVDQASPK